MSKNLIVDAFDVPLDSKWSITESEDDQVVDGINILGRASGQFFITEGESLNKRFYSRKLWEKAINENSDRMTNGEMLGTIGHGQPLDDQALLEGKVSHKITKLSIDESTGAGMGEILILGTSAGRELNALLRGGVRLKVSSRALGEYKGKTKTGSNIIDESTFVLEGFDFVQRPGVPAAVPKLIENDQSSDNLNTNPNSSESKTSMSELNFDKLYEDANRAKLKLEETNGNLLEKLTLRESDNASLTKLAEERAEQITNLKAIAATNDEKATKLATDLEEANAKLAAYEALGTVEALTETNNSSLAKLATYEALGTPEMIAESFEAITKLVEDYKDLGTVAEIDKVMDMVEEYQDFGTIATITEMAESLDKYLESADSIDELHTALDLLEKYVELGTPSEISQVFKATSEVIEKSKNEALSKQVENFCTEHKVQDREVARELIQKHGYEAAEKIVENFSSNSSSVSSRYKRDQKLDETLDTNKKIEENEPSSLYDNRTSRSRLFEKFSR